jgi:hypothetical protein
MLVANVVTESAAVRQLGLLVRGLLADAADEMGRPLTQSESASLIAEVLGEVDGDDRDVAEVGIPDEESGVGNESVWRKLGKALGIVGEGRA